MVNLFPRRPMFIARGVGLVEIVAGTVAGAWIYRSEAAPSSSTAAVRLWTAPKHLRRKQNFREEITHV